MAGSARLKNPEKIKSEIAHLSTLDVTSLRTVWRTTFKYDGEGIPRGILLRMLAWRLQERALGGFDKATERALARYAKADGALDKADRHLGVGSVLVREYQGSRHTVTVVSDGFVWRDQAYPNLSKIAHAITGVKWNGPRFFGLRKIKPEKSPAGEIRA